MRENLSLNLPVQRRWSGRELLVKLVTLSLLIFSIRQASVYASNEIEPPRSLVGKIVAKSDKFLNSYMISLGSGNGLLIRDILEIRRDGTKIAEAMIIECNENTSCIAPMGQSDCAAGDEVRFLRRSYQQSNEVAHFDPNYFKIKYVPFVKQLPYLCGPACVEMVLKYYGIEKAQQEIKDNCDPEDVKETSSARMVEYLNSIGSETFSIRGDFEQLKKYILESKPVILLQWKDTSKQTRHYRIAIGYDDSKRVVICQDPQKGPDFLIDYDEFNELWSVDSEEVHTENLMIIIAK